MIPFRALFIGVLLHNACRLSVGFGVNGINGVGFGVNFLSLSGVDLDGEVTFSDISPFIGILAAGTYLIEADCNLDGVVDFADIPAFIAILQAG